MHMCWVTFASYTVGLWTYGGAFLCCAACPVLRSAAALDFNSERCCIPIFLFWKLYIIKMTKSISLPWNVYSFQVIWVGQGMNVMVQIKTISLFWALCKGQQNPGSLLCTRRKISTSLDLAVNFPIQWTIVLPKRMAVQNAFQLISNGTILQVF